MVNDKTMRNYKRYYQQLNESNYYFLKELLLKHKNTFELNNNPSKVKVFDDILKDIDILWKQ